MASSPLEIREDEGNNAMKNASEIAERACVVSSGLLAGSVFQSAISSSLPHLTLYYLGALLLLTGTVTTFSILYKVKNY